MNSFDVCKRKIIKVHGDISQRNLELATGFRLQNEAETANMRFPGMVI